MKVVRAVASPFRIGELPTYAPMHVERRHSAEELDLLAPDQPRVAAWRRFRAVTPARLGCTARGVQKWVARYYAGGPDGLADRPGRGRKPVFDPGLHDRLRRRIEASPNRRGRLLRLTRPKIRRIIRDEFGIMPG